jgi:hypothetical protein
MEDPEGNKELAPLICASLVYWDDEFQIECAKGLTRAVKKKVS